MIQAEVRKAAAENSGLTSPRKLNFDLPQSVLDKIFFAEAALGDEIQASETFVLEFTGFGKNLIVQNKLSPDSFVQLSMQCAYYRLYGKNVSQYEPVLMKSFYHGKSLVRSTPCGQDVSLPSSCIFFSGRTEAMRAATCHASIFCKLWLDRSSTKKNKLEALRVATEYHSAGIKLSASGKGLERHLFALIKIAEKNGIPTPDFFSSVAYNKLNHTVLSTSNCGNPSLRLFGFGPVVHDGFGIGYIIRDNGIQFSISSKHRQTKRFASTLNKTLFDMGDLLESLSSVTVSSAPVMTKEQIVDAQHCDSYGDAPGESRNSSSERQTLARVLHRQPSVRASELSRFGQLLTPSLSAGEVDRGK